MEPTSETPQLNMWATLHGLRSGVAAWTVRTRLSFVGVVFVLAALIGLTGGSQPAHATYPGASNGRLAFGFQGADGNVDIYSVLPNGNDFRRLTDAPGLDACAAYSPDGKEIAFCSNRSGALEIWKMQHNGTRQQQVTHAGGRLFFPDFAPDGARIAFMGQRPSDSVDHIFVVDASGMGPITLLTSERDGNNRYPVFSPDGRQIAFISDRPGACDTSGTPQVWVMRVDGSDPKQLTCDPSLKDQLPDWSPDGSKLAYESGSIPNGRIFSMNADGSQQRQLTSGPGDDFGTAWSPDGRQIAFGRDFGNGNRPVYVMNADGSDQHAVHPGSAQFVPAWQPRGVGG